MQYCFQQLQPFCPLFIKHPKRPWQELKSKPFTPPPMNRISPLRPPLHESFNSYCCVSLYLFPAEWMPQVRGVNRPERRQWWHGEISGGWMVFIVIWMVFIVRCKYRAGCLDTMIISQGRKPRSRGQTWVDSGQRITFPSQLSGGRPGTAQLDFYPIV